MTRNSVLQVHLTKLSIPVVVVAFDPFLEVAQAYCQVTRPAQIDNKVPSAFARRSCMIIVVIIRVLHLHHHKTCAYNTG